jgi:hypothetical protein
MGALVESRIPELVARARKAREAGDTESYDKVLFLICTALELPPPMKPRWRRPLSGEERASLEQRLRSLGILE